MFDHTRPVATGFVLACLALILALRHVHGAQAADRALVRDPLSQPSSASFSASSPVTWNPIGSDWVATVEINATDQEAQEGYFALGPDTMVVVRPGGPLHNWLRRRVGHRVRVTLAVTPETAR